MRNEKRINNRGKSKVQRLHQRESTRSNRSNQKRETCCHAAVCNRRRRNRAVDIGLFTQVSRNVTDSRAANQGRQSSRTRRILGRGDSRRKILDDPPDSSLKLTDDNELNYETISDYLATQNFRVLLAHSSHELRRPVISSPQYIAARAFAPGSDQILLPCAHAPKSFWHCCHSGSRA